MKPIRKPSRRKSNIELLQDGLTTTIPEELISILIPFKKLNLHVLECLEKISNLNYANFEIILLPDESFKNSEISQIVHNEQISIKATGNVPPGTKRNIGTKHAKGSIIAFIDDDAYPDQNWLKNAVKHFGNHEVAAVGGPNLTPPSNGIMQKAGGMILQSRIGGGSFSHRYKSHKIREDNDLPTVNLIIKKDILTRLGGFDTKYYPGDDTYLCLQITNKLGKKILYSPDVIVYHHRRPLFIPHMQQIWNYGKHRGYFAKKFPQTSRKPLFFLPTILVLSLIFSPFLLLLPTILGQIYLATILLYFFLIFIESIKTGTLRLSSLIFVGIILTHVSYGIGFLVGLLSQKLDQ